MAVLELFGPRRGVLVRAYELLKVAVNPMPRTKVWQAANYNPQRGVNYLFMWLWEQGFLERIDGVARQNNIKGLFVITEKGKGMVRAYEALFDIMGLSDKVLTRFPREEIVVKTQAFSGLKTRA